MSAIIRNTSLTLNGSSALTIGGDRVTWSDRYTDGILVWADKTKPMRKLDVALSGSDWNTTILHTSGAIAATVTDGKTGSDRSVQVILLQGLGDNTVTLGRTTVQMLSTGNGNDTITYTGAGIGYIATNGGDDRVVTGGQSFVDMIALGSGNNSARIGGSGAGAVRGGEGSDTITAEAEIDSIATGRGNDLLVTGSFWVGSIDVGRGKDVVELGRGGADYIYLGRDADTIIFTPSPEGNGAIVHGGGNVSTATDSDLDHADFSRFRVALAVNLDSGRVESSQGYYQLMEFENLTGGSKNDQLTGSWEANLLSGGGGKDTLDGGRDADTLVGGAGADRFRISSIDDSTEELPDEIRDFTRKQGDKIDLGGIDADSTAEDHQAFRFIGKKQFSDSAGELRAEISGGKTLILGDVDGDGVADLSILLGSALALKASDFLL